LKWEDFSAVFTKHFPGTPVNKLKTILSIGNKVEKKSWTDFADWFAPYSSSYPDHHMQDVAEIVGSEYVQHVDFD
jgi:hypothetical protein